MIHVAIIAVSLTAAYLAGGLTVYIGLPRLLARHDARHEQAHADRNDLW